MEYAEFFVSKDLGVNPYGWAGGYPYGENGAPVCVRIGGVKVNSTTLTHPDGWAGVQPGYWAYCNNEDVGSECFCQVQGVDGNNITFAPELSAGTTDWEVYVGGAWPSIRHANHRLSAITADNYFLQQNIQPRINVKSGTYSETGTTEGLEGGSSIAAQVVVEGFYAEPGDGGRADILVGGAGILFSPTAALATGVWKNLNIEIVSTSVSPVNCGLRFENCAFFLQNTIATVFTLLGIAKNCLFARAAYSVQPMVILGTAGVLDSCEFSSPGSSRGIIISSPGSIVRHCLFRDLGQAIYVQTVPTNIEHCTFLWCSEGIGIQPNTQNSARQRIVGNIFSEISGYGIKNGAGTNIRVFREIKHNRFYSCTSGPTLDIELDETNQVLLDNPYPLEPWQDDSLDPSLVDSIELPTLYNSTMTSYFTPGFTQPKSPRISRSRVVGGV